MPTVSPAQHRLMEAAAHTPGGFGGVPQQVGKEFVGKDAAARLDALVSGVDALSRRMIVLSHRNEARTARFDDVWNESDHPRAEDGKFGSGGTSGNKSREPEKTRERGAPPTSRTSKTKLSKPLTPDEEKTMASYGQGNSYNVNKFLRDQKAAKAELKKTMGSRYGEAVLKMEKHIKNVQSAIDKSELEEPTKLYRGVTDFSYVREAVSGLKSGDAVSFGTFSSASRSKEWAEDFTKGGKGDPGIIIINAQKGAKALDMDKFARFGEEEQEMLLSNKAKFRFEKLEGNTVYLTLES